LPSTELQFLLLLLFLPLYLFLLLLLLFLFLFLLLSLLLLPLSLLPPQLSPLPSTAEASSRGKAWSSIACGHCL
jgi:hypothetical protein